MIGLMSVVRLCSAGASAESSAGLGKRADAGGMQADHSDVVDVLTTAVFGAAVGLLSGALEGRRRFVRLLLEG